MLKNQYIPFKVLGILYLLGFFASASERTFSAIHLAPASILQAQKTSSLKEKLRKEMPWKDLIRNPGQEEPEAVNDYWLNNAEARERFQKFLAIAQSSEYQNKSEAEKDSVFETMLIEAHILATQGSTGNRKYRPGVTPGTFRPDNKTDGTALSSIYKEESRTLAALLNAFNLKHGLSTPFTTEYLNSKQSLPLAVEVNISEAKSHLEEFKKAEKEGTLLDFYRTVIKRESFSLPVNRGSTHVYPDMAYWAQYRTSARNQLEKILALSNTNSPEEWISGIAEFYHTLANIRPFDQINNSLFMNFVNALLRRQGLEGIPHGILDHMAMRMSLNDFKILFRDKVMETNPGLSVKNPLLEKMLRDLYSPRTKDLALFKNANPPSINAKTLQEALRQASFFSQIAQNKLTLSDVGGQTLERPFLSLFSFETLNNLKKNQQIVAQAS